MSSHDCVLARPHADKWCRWEDYILSPEMCVERKSLSDLRQSFLSGRLYNQAEAMTKHYKTPILLIEFDRERAFALHSTAELGSDINVSAARTTLLSACIVK